MASKDFLRIDNRACTGCVSSRNIQRASGSTNPDVRAQIEFLLKETSRLQKEMNIPASISPTYLTFTCEASGSPTAKEFYAWGAGVVDGNTGPIVPLNGTISYISLSCGSTSTGTVTVNFDGVPSPATATVAAQANNVSAPNIIIPANTRLSVEVTAGTLINGTVVTIYVLV